jgi:hypothetical protein
MRRRDFIGAVGGVATIWPIAVRAQQASKLPTIGFRIAVVFAAVHFVKFWHKAAVLIALVLECENGGLWTNSIPPRS